MLLTYARTLFNDIFKNNFVIKTLKLIVNFYCNLWLKDTNTIKFGQNVPMKDMEKKKVLFFQSITGDKIDCR